MHIFEAWIRLAGREGEATVSVSPRSERTGPTAEAVCVSLGKTCNSRVTRIAFTRILGLVAADSITCVALGTGTAEVGVQAWDALNTCQYTNPEIEIELSLLS